MPSALRLGVVLLLLSTAVVCAEIEESKDITTKNDNINNNNINEVKKEADLDTPITTNNDNNEVKKEADGDTTTTNDNNEVRKEAGQETEEKRHDMVMGNPYFSSQNYFSPWSFMNGMYPGYGYQNGLFSPFMNGMYTGYGFQNGLFSPFMNGMYPGYGYQNGLFSPFMNGMYPGSGYPNGLLFSPFHRYLVPTNDTYAGGYYPGGFAGTYPMYPYSPGYLANPMMYSGYPFAGGYPGYPMQGMFPGYPGYGYQNGHFSPFMNGMYPGYGYQNGLFSPFMNGMYSGYGFQNGLFSPFMNGMYPGYGYQNGLFSPFMNGMYPGYGFQNGLFSPFMNGMYPGYGYPMQGMFPGYPYQAGYPGFGMQSWYGGMGMSDFHSPLGGMGSLFYPQPGYVGWNYPHWHQTNASKESPLLKAIYNLGGESTGESTAPQRPSQDEIRKMLSKNPWVKEQLFNNTDDEIVKALTEANSVDELKTKLNLSKDMVSNLNTVFMAVQNDRFEVVMELGEEKEQWEDFKKFIKAMLDSGFKA